MREVNSTAMGFHTICQIWERFPPTCPVLHAGLYAQTKAAGWAAGSCMLQRSSTSPDTTPSRRLHLCASALCWGCEHWLPSILQWLHWQWRHAAGHHRVSNDNFLRGIEVLALASPRVAAT